MNAPQLMTIVLVSLVLTIKALGQNEADLAKELWESLLHGDGHLRVAKQISAATPEQRKAMLTAIVSIIRETVSKPWPTDRDPSDYTFTIARCAHVLREASDDGATLAAFGDNLNRIGVNCDAFVIEALSCCRDPRAVEVIAGHARARIKAIKQCFVTKEIKKWFPDPPPSMTQDEIQTLGDQTRSFYSALKGLARSPNSFGRTVARELGEEFVKLYDGSPYRERVLQSLRTDTGIDLVSPDVEVSPHHIPAAKPLPKRPLLPEEREKTSEPEKPDLPTLAWPLWLASAVVLGLVVLLLWFLRKK